jgi:hypothetical protein
MGDSDATSPFGAWWVRNTLDTPRILPRASRVAIVLRATNGGDVSEPGQREDGAEPESDPSPAKSDADQAKDKEQEMEESGEELPG